MSNSGVNILAYGIGTYNFAVVQTLARLGHHVVVSDIDDGRGLISGWGKTGIYDRYDWTRQYGLHENIEIHLDPLIDATELGCKYIILGPSMEGLEPAIQNIGNSDNRTIIITLQKGLSPDGLTPQEIVRKRFRNLVVMGLTGAGFGPVIAAGESEYQAVISYQPAHKEIAREFGNLFKGSKFWPAYSNDQRGVSICASLRPCISCAQGLFEGYLKRTRGKRRQRLFANLPSVRAGILLEYEALAEALGTSPATLDPRSEVAQVLHTDLELCYGQGRNFRYGFALGKGTKPVEAYAMVSSDGVIECINTIDSVMRELYRIYGRCNYPNSVDKLTEDFPYFMMLCEVIINGKSMKWCENQLLARQSRRFE